MLERCLEIGVDFEKIAIGVIPIGTGNDFSRSLGWGSSTINFDLNQMDQLNEMVRQWKDARVGSYDMWDICI